MPSQWPKNTDFLKPWKMVDHDESFEIQDAAGVHLAYVYYTDDPNRRNFMHRLSKDNARKLAVQILRLPELVRIARGIEQDIDPDQA